MRGFKFFGSFAAVLVGTYYVLNLAGVRDSAAVVFVLFAAAWLMWQAYRRWGHGL